MPASRRSQRRPRSWLMFVVAGGDVVLAGFIAAPHDLVNGFHRGGLRFFNTDDLRLEFHFCLLGQFDGLQRTKDALFKDGVNRFHSMTKPCAYLIELASRGFLGLMT